MKNMKVYVLDLGYGVADSNWFEANSTVATIFDENPPRKWMTTPFYALLIDHPSAGWLLYDTGPVPAADWAQGLQAVVKVTSGSLSEQLEKVGVKPEEIKHVILSHMHIDHIGGIGLLKDTAEFYVDRREAEAAYTTVLATCDVGTYGFYPKKEILTEVKKMNYLDVDGTLELFPGVHVIDVRGHTAGTLGLLLELESGNILVTSDACNTQANYNGVPGGINFDSLAAGKSLQRLHRLAAERDVKEIWVSHDEAQFAAMKKAPECYA